MSLRSGTRVPAIVIVFLSVWLAIFVWNSWYYSGLRLTTFAVVFGAFVDAGTLAATWPIGYGLAAISWLRHRRRIRILATIAVAAAYIPVRITILNWFLMPFGWFQPALPFWPQQVLFFAPSNLLMFILGLAAAQVFWHQRDLGRHAIAAERLRADLAQARLQMIKAQLQPHFLFNTLNSISALVYSRPAAAKDALRDLEALLFDVIERRNEQEVSLDTELRLVNRYLAMEKMRFGDRLEIIIDVPPHLTRAKVPDLLLQPLVENAIRHGTSRKRGPCCIWITAKSIDEQLVITVEDDGAGIPSNWKPGVGLGGTRSRLAWYGNGRVDVSARPEGGTRATVIMPLTIETSS